MRVYIYLMVFVLVLSTVIATGDLSVSSTVSASSNTQTDIPEFGLVLGAIALIGAIAIFEINRKS